VGDAMFRAAEGPVEESLYENAKIKQGFIETSNVNGLRAMTEMIDLMRGYESYQKVIQFLDDVTRRSISDVGKL
jgi:flagellar basal-body rod protein FlgF